MPDIYHRLSMNVPRDDVYRALRPDALLAGFGSIGVTLRMLSFEDGARVAWRCTDGPPEWVGTDVTIELARDRDGDETILSLSHRNWPAESPHLAECTTAWARTLFQLKRWLETPEPDDLAAQ